VKLPLKNLWKISKRVAEKSLENGFINYEGEVPHIYEVLHG